MGNHIYHRILVSLMILIMVSVLASCTSQGVDPPKENSMIPAENEDGDKNAQSGAQGKKEKPQHYLETFYDPALDESWLLYDGKLLDGRVGSYIYSYLEGSEDGSVFLLCTRTLMAKEDEGQTFYLDSSNLYYVNAMDGTVTCAEEYINYAFLSSDGKSAFVQKDEMLFLIDFSSGERTTVMDGMVFNSPKAYTSEWALSPDRKCFLYEAYNYANKKSELYYYNGQNNKIGENLDAVAVTEEEGIYFIDRQDSGLYFMGSPESERALVLSGEKIKLRLTNKDHTQLIVTVRNGFDTSMHDIYFIEKGTEATMLSEYMGEDIWQVNNIGDRDAPLDFRDSVFLCYYENNNQYTNHYLTGNLDFELINSMVSRSQSLRDDGKTLFFLGGYRFHPADENSGKGVSGDLTKLNVEDRSNFEILAEGVVAFSISSDLQMVYFINEYDELYYQNGNSVPVKIADDVDRMTISHDDYLFFLVDYDSENNTGTLYACTDEKDKEIVADNIYRLYSTSAYTIYFTKSDALNRDIYITTSGKEFTCILEDVQVDAVSGSGFKPA